MSDIDRMAADLDRWHGRTWDLYRLSSGGWNARCGDKSHHGCTPTDAVAAAHADGPPLPTIPRRPAVIAQGRVVKDGSRWWVRLLFDDGSSSGHARFETKKEATKAADITVERNRQALAEWDERYASTVAAGGEGTEWRWQ